MIEIEVIRKLAQDADNIEMTLHVLERCRKRKISSGDIMNVLKHGEIIEQYPDDYPYPSCLELGYSLMGECLHVCCGVGDNKVWVITSYYPSDEEWEHDKKTRKAVT